MVVLFFLVYDIVGALCPYNKLLQLLESKQRQQARSSARCYRRIAGANQPGSTKGGAAECQLNQWPSDAPWFNDASRLIAVGYQNVCDGTCFSSLHAFLAN
jgi:hypothetical protein